MYEEDAWDEEAGNFTFHLLKITYQLLLDDKYSSPLGLVPCLKVFHFRNQRIVLIDLAFLRMSLSDPVSL